MPPKKSKQPQPRQPAPAPTPISQRGAEWQAERLTGARAIQGKLPNGEPRFVYEVKWTGEQRRVELLACS